jgi:hypothetical protein
MKTFLYVWQYLAEFFLEWEIFKKKSCRENQNTFYVQQLFSKNVLFIR